MKVYLLNPPYLPHFGRSMRWQDTGRGGTLYYPIWLSYAAALLEMDHKVRLVDAPAWAWQLNTVLNDIKKFAPEIVVVDTSFPSLDNDLTIANQIQEDCQSKVIIVGPPASQFTEEILDSGIDVVARHEYEFTLKEIADSGFKLDGIKGISYKLNNNMKHNPERSFSSSADLDQIPFVTQVYKKHLRINDYFLGSSLYPLVQIFTARGCPFGCIFCSWPYTLMGRKYRTRSVSNVLDEFSWIETNLSHVKEVFIEDDTFTIDSNRVSQFCSGYRKRGLKIAWACNVRADIRYELIREMKNSNCRLLVVGYESGVDDILTKINKGISTTRMKQFARDAKRAGMLVHGDFILGLPGETRHTINKTYKFARDINPEILQVSVATPFPGTEFYDWCLEHDYLVTRDRKQYLDSDGHQKAIISYPLLSENEITTNVRRFLQRYYLSPRYIPIAARQVFRKRGWDEFRRLATSARHSIRYLVGGTN